MTTGLQWNAGTNAAVFALVGGGSKGFCTTNQLDNPGNDREPGNTDSYTDEENLGHCLGLIKEIELFSDWSKKQDLISRILEYCNTIDYDFSCWPLIRQIRRYKLKLDGLADFFVCPLASLHCFQYGIGKPSDISFYISYSQGIITQPEALVNAWYPTLALVELSDGNRYSCSMEGWLGSRIYHGNHVPSMSCRLVNECSVTSVFKSFYKW